MNPKELIMEQEKIDKEVSSIAKQLGLEACYDGVISPEHYSTTPIKTSWVFKEPHEKGGDYDYKSSIVKRLNDGDTKRNKYFDPMRYLEFSLKNNLVPYADIPDADTDVNVSNLLLQTAFTNINKIVGGARINPNTFRDRVDQFSSLVRRQLTVAKPKIIIAAGTLPFFERYGYLVNASERKKSYREYYISSEGVIILDCYHPSQNPISQEKFCNDIIMALRDVKQDGLIS